MEFSENQVYKPLYFELFLMYIAQKDNIPFQIMYKAHGKSIVPPQINM